MLQYHHLQPSHRSNTRLKLVWNVAHEVQFIILLCLLFSKWEGINLTFKLYNWRGNILQAVWKSTFARSRVTTRPMSSLHSAMSGLYMSRCLVNFRGRTWKLSRKQTNKQTPPNKHFWTSNKSWSKNSSAEMKAENIYLAIFAVQGCSMWDPQCSVLCTLAWSKGTLLSGTHFVSGFLSASSNLCLKIKKQEGKKQTNKQTRFTLGS